jgi:hypothetical protein
MHAFPGIISLARRRAGISAAPPPRLSARWREHGYDERKCEERFSHYLHLLRSFSLAAWIWAGVRRTILRHEKLVVGWPPPDTLQHLMFPRTVHEMTADAKPSARDLLICAKHLFVPAMRSVEMARKRAL